MATQLEIVNRVLRRLRESEVASITESDYSILIAEFVADIHREVAEAWFWPSTSKTVDVETVAGSEGYNLHAIVGSGGSVVSGGNVTTERSVPRVRTDGNVDAHIGESSTDKNKRQLILLSDEQRHVLANMQGTESVADYPTHVSFRRDNANTWAMQLWPSPSVTGRYIRMAWWIPEADLEVDGTTDDTEIYIPNHPIYLGALWLAMNERGEEMGEPGNMAERRYYAALANEKERAIQYEESTRRFDWFR